MLLKRLLLLPEKGDVIICILLLLNILCGEPVENVSSESVPTTAISFMRKNNFIHVSPRRLSGTVLVTVCYLISTFHLPRINAEERVSLNQRPTHQPAKKTDLPMIKRTGATNGSIYDMQDYNKRENAMRYGESGRFNNQLVNASGSVSESSKSNKHSATKDQVKLSSLEANLISVKAQKKNATLQKATSRAKTQPVKQSGNHLFSNLTKLRRRPKLLKEITMYNRQNCLAKLLCGVQVARPPTKSSSAVNDYAYLVKAFFDRFSIRGIVTDAIDAAFEYERDALEDLEEEDEEEDDDVDSDRRKKKKQKNSKTKIGGAALHKSRRPAFEKYNPKYYNSYDEDLEDLELEELINDDVPDFMTDDLLIRRSGKRITHVTPFRQLNCNDSKVEFLNGTNDTEINQRHKRSHLLPVDLNRIRKRRGLIGNVKRGFMGFFNPRFDKTAYLDKRQLDLHSTQNETKQLNIAEEIAARIRSPRQCRLLNWFGSSNGLNNGNQNGLTTTITTITNTGGMVGNMERLGGLQSIPQTGSGSGALGQPSSQVVTVIQQSPAGQGQASSSASSTTAPNTILNTMGQSASTAMNVASQIGSTICPFNTQELQELILKAQTAPFPHFLTTTPATSPFLPAHINQAIPIASSTASTSTQKATQAPPPSSSTMAIVLNQGAANSGRPYAHIYGNYPHPQPIFSNYPAQVYPTPFVSESKFSHQTNQPQLLPPLGIAVEDDDEEIFEDDPYALNLKPVVTKVKVKPTPKWMTTTPMPLDDTLYSYNDPLPKYVYDKQKQSSYKVSPKPKPQKQTQSHNYLRQFHQPPIVYDSKKYHFDSARRPIKPTVSTKKVPEARKKKKPADINPKQKVEWNSDSEEDNSDEENSETADGDDEEESEETNSGSVEPRSNLNLRNRFIPPLPFKRPPAPQLVDLEDDVSNEAEEKKEKDAEGNGDEEDEEEDSDEDENGGKRSYEKNDFSKDRGGPPTQSTTTMKPKTYANANFNNAKSGGFMSQFFGSLTSMFNRKDDGSRIRIKIKTPFKTRPLPPRPLEMPPTHVIKPLNSNMMDAQNESDEPEGGDEGQDESDENDNENDEYSDEGKAATQQGNTKQSEKPVWVIQQPEPKPIQDPTLLPVIIEDSTSWANPFQGPGPSPKRKIYGEDDSGEPHLRQNPVESYTAALKQKQKVVNPQILSNNGISSNTPAIAGNNALPQFDPNSGQKSYQFHDLPISSELRNWILDVTKDHGLTRVKEKEVKAPSKDKTPSDESDEEYDDDEESNESDEDDVSQSYPKSRRIPEQRQVSYVPLPEPID